jgi:CRP/FNR family cyclic AMP-dependent transcriptional regulator
MRTRLESVAQMTNHEPGPHLPHAKTRVTDRSAMHRLFHQCAWFNALSPSHQDLLLTTSHAEQKDAGDWIARRNAPADYWIGVHSGLVKLAIYGASGRSCTLSGVPPGGWFGEGSVIKREARKYDVSAVQPSLVMYVPSWAFHRLLSSSLPFNGFVIHQLNNRMGEFIASIQNSRLLDVDARVAQSLAQMFNLSLYPNTSLTLDISQEELGLLAGVSRQRINQALQILEKLRIVRLSYSRVEVLDLDRLSSYGQDQI